MTRQVIEYAGIPVGIVIPHNGSLKFIAVKFHVHELDGQLFASPSDVSRAIRKLMLGSGGSIPLAPRDQRELHG
ncbi:hypothetical protein [Rhizobium leguminosarum]|uniref:hypothetical protein n=1 Tax=Rhizobium leguminosarum TaxID=384 RepID=UPI001AE61DA0|nr:hypothetical protein [Rhizobium leguminosarum]MBP2444182.1 hypothetical protein [Rhizobium leguminosarum]